MLSYHSPGANWAKLGRNKTAFATLTAGALLSLSAVGVFSPKMTAAQTDPQTQINFTYLMDTSGIGGQISTKQSDFIEPGVAFVSVDASFTGRGYGLGSVPSFDEFGPGGLVEEALVENGDAFIVTPIIDPDLYVNYILRNETGTILSSLTFTLEDTSDFYFFNSDTSGTGFRALSDVKFSDSIGLTSFQGNEREGFRSLTFSAPKGRSGISQNGIGVFNFAIHVPDGKIGQQFTTVLSPNGATPLSVRGVPEPGTLLLLLPMGVLLGMKAKARSRKRLS